MPTSPVRSNIFSSPQRLRTFPAAFDNPSNILTFKGGKQAVYPYPWANQYKTTLMPPSLLWKHFSRDDSTHAPHCLHGRPVRTFKHENSDCFIAACCNKKPADQCNFWLNLTEIRQNAKGELIAEQDVGPSSDDFTEDSAPAPVRQMLSQSSAPSSPSPTRPRRPVASAAATRVRRAPATRSVGHQVGGASASAPLLRRREYRNAVASSSSVTIDLTREDRDVRRILRDVPRIQLLNILLNTANSSEDAPPNDHNPCLAADVFFERHRFCPVCNSVMQASWVPFHVCDLTEL